MVIATSDIQSFTVSTSLRGVFSGDIGVTNQNRQYTGSYRYTPVRLNLASTATTTGIGSPACFSGSTTILGLVSEVEDVRDISSLEANLKFRSFFATSYKKAINTEYFISTASTVLSSILEGYAGIPSALVDISLSPSNTIVGVVSGNNVLEECVKIAQASEANLFVDIGGILKVRNWKDASDSIDVVIPPESLKGASILRGTSVGPTVIAVKGRYISNFDAGEQFYTVKNPADQTSADPNKSVAKQGMKDACSKVGLGRPRLDMLIKKLAATAEDLANSAFRITETTTECPTVDSSSGVITNRQTVGGKFHGINIIADAQMEVVLSDDCDGYLEPGDFSWEYDVVGQRRKHTEKDDPGMLQRPDLSNRLKALRLAENAVRQASGRPVSQLGTSVDGTLDNVRTSDERDDQRIEMFVVDDDLVAEFGIIIEQLDNQYISDYETLFDVAIRRFQEYKMQRNVWQVEVAYLPCLSVNDVVQFVTPDGNDTVTGVLSSIKLSYTSAPEVLMSLTVESFEDIGATDYTSGNMLLYPNLEAINGVDWIGNNAVRMLRGYVALDSGAQLSQSFANLEVGADYTFTLTATVDTAGSFTMSMGSGSQLVGSSGTFFVTFTAGSSTATALITGVTGGWYITNMIVVKEVTK